MTPRVLITGGAGFIGMHVAEELLAAGYEVRVFEPCVAFEASLEELVAWLAGAMAIDRIDQATEQLARRGLAA
jgi:nucleoside-diphosphate-sugar epimerase